jgi:protein-tyrosine phosphatase
MGMFFIGLMLVVIAWLLWLNYQTLDGFNEDLKQLRLLVGHIERKLSGEPQLPVDMPADPAE